MEREPGNIIGTVENMHCGSYMNVLDLELGDRRCEPAAVLVHDVGMEHGRCSHVVREHFYKQVNVSVLGGQRTPYHVV